MSKPTGRVPIDPSPTAWRAGAAGFGRRALKTVSRFPLAHFGLAVGRTGLFLARSIATRKVAGAIDIPGVREPRLSAALTAQVAMDECILAIMNNPSRLPEESELVRVGDELDQAWKVYGERGWLENPRAFHGDPPPLERPGVRPARWLGLNYERLTFDSLYEPHSDEPGRDRWLAHEANRTAYAWVLRHRDGPRPWLVCLHGFGTGRAFMDLYAFRAAFLHHALGINLAIPVHPMHGARSSGGFSGGDFMSHDLLNVVHGMAQSAWDTRRVVSWIRTQEPAAIGLYGVSLGGYLTALTAGLEDGLDCAIAGIPICDLPGLYLHHAPARLIRHPNARALLGEQVAEVLSVVSPLSFEPLVPHDRRFMFAGLIDRMATPEQALALWEHWGQPRIAWYGGNHVGYLWSDRVEALVREALESTGFASPEAA
ncbi:MAG: alpha/beta hydrolase [Actinobacteria bacterium]|nr:alpha/beta hydrolase [Actinomycetota bacterium]